MEINEMTTTAELQTLLASRTTTGAVHFFDKGSMRFFNSRAGETVYANRYFITSEKYQDEPRMYTVREITIEPNESGSGVYVDITAAADGFQAYDTSRQAESAIKRLLK